MECRILRVAFFVIIGYLLASCGVGSSNSTSTKPLANNFIIVGDQGTIANYNAASNQITDMTESTESTYFKAVAYDGNNLVVAGTNRITTFNLKNGVLSFVGYPVIGIPCYSAMYHDGRFIVGGGLFAAMILSSIDGGESFTRDNPTSWSSSFGSFNAMTYGGGKFIAVGPGAGGRNIIATSIDGESWNNGYGLDYNSLNGVAYGNGKFVVVGSGGEIITSTNGESWIKSPAPNGSIDLFGVIYGNNKFVSVGNSGTLLVSTDGILWKTESSGTTHTLHAIAYGNNHFVAVGDNGTIIKSIDGESWNVLPLMKGGKNNYGITYIGSN
ncbi:MAG: WD40/YVTN/BNR-like repeat-containing protein [Neisseriaceae bacterium]